MFPINGVYDELSANISINKVIGIVNHILGQCSNAHLKWSTEEEASHFWRKSIFNSLFTSLAGQLALARRS